MTTTNSDEFMTAEELADAEQTEAELGGEDAGGPLSARDKLLLDMAKRRGEEVMSADGFFEGSKKDGDAELFGDEPEKPAKETRKIRVDGEDRDIDLDDVIAEGIKALQKESAAANRLREASLTQKALEQRSQEIEALAIELQEQQDRIQGEKLSEEDASALNAAAGEVYEKILFDHSKEDAVEALKKLVTGRHGTTQDRQSIIAEATRIARLEVQKAEAIRAEAAEERERERAIAVFRDEFKEVVADPELYRLADLKTLDVQKEHPDWGLDSILKEAGKRVMAWRNPSLDRRDMKRGLKNISGTSGRAPAQEQQRPKTASELIAEERKARGLPVY